MEFTIHNVGHGFCAHLRHDNGNVMLWDCGHKNDPEYRPSVFLRGLGISTVNRLFVTNYDEDHISDLPNLLNSVDINILNRNQTLTAKQLRSLKEETGPVSNAMEALLGMITSYSGGVSSPPEFPNISFERFECTYEEFQDTNNLSTVTFLKTPGPNFIIPGDIEIPAWEVLLNKPGFKELLSETNVFIASHHGRTSGHCEEIFAYCTPNVVIFSDGAQQHATQEEANTYAKYARGIQYLGKNRYVLTTRNDGSLTWTF